MRSNFSGNWFELSDWTGWTARLFDIAFKTSFVILQPMLLGTRASSTWSSASLGSFAQRLRETSGNDIEVDDLVAMLEFVRADLGDLPLLLAIKSEGQPFRLTLAGNASHLFAVSICPAAR